MNLVIDWGNTRIKAAAFDELALCEQWSFTEEKELIAFLQKSSFQHILLSSVGGDTTKIRNAVSELSKILILTHATPVPIQILYGTPTTLGMDRIAAACAAFQLFPNTACLVVDLGSCINYEFIHGNGSYHGGAISPGITMRFKAMNHFTAKLPLLRPTASPLLIGNSTETCMQSGVMNGVLAEVTGFIDSIRKENPGCSVILCGGDVHFFEDQINDANFVPELVLVGLNAILRYNIGKSVSSGHSSV